MSSLRIRLFGGVHLSRGGAPLPPFPTQRARSLFAYLTVNRSRTHTREVLVGTLWGEEPEDSARRSFRTALWRARRTSEAGASERETPVILVEGQKVGFNLGAGHWLDVQEFEDACRKGGRRSGRSFDAERIRWLRVAVELYTGDALEGMYDEWCLNERERLRLMYASALELLVEAEQERKDWASAIAYGQRLLRIEPLREHIHRDLMRCYVSHGDRPAALHQYGECARILEAELGIEPMDETTDLFVRIRGDRGAGTGGKRAQVRPMEPKREMGQTDGYGGGAALSRVRQLLANVNEALEELRGVKTHLEESRTQLREMVSAAGSGEDVSDVQEPPGTLV